MSYEEWEGSPKRITLELEPKTFYVLTEFAKENGMSRNWLINVLLKMNMDSLAGVKKLLEEGVIPASRERFVLDEFYGLYNRSYRDPDYEKKTKPVKKTTKDGKVRMRGRSKFAPPKGYVENRWKKREDFKKED